MWSLGVAIITAALNMAWTLWNQRKSREVTRLYRRITDVANDASAMYDRSQEFRDEAREYYDRIEKERGNG